ncbi:MAG: hypothetical protein JNM56_23300 [Planctomycetia bacterium]|nr:hypothetical protein [Planctomycetia bacterium]
MNKLTWLRQAFPAGAIAATLLAICLGDAEPAHGQAKDGGDPWKTAKFLGAGACMKCHASGPSGNDTDDLVLLTEFATWRMLDRHSLAYLALESPRGKQIGEALKLDVTKAETGCLACHTMNFPKDRQGDNFSIKDGVSCDGCHGPAERWLTPHFAQKNEWRAKTPAEKEALGMRDLRDPAKRATVCLSCHQGDAAEGKVVTHAMFAAGHPPLRPVEVAGLSACLPTHWRELKDVPYFQKAPADIRRANRLDTATSAQAQLVRASSLLGLRGEMNLIAARADFAAKDKARWPELAMTAFGGGDDLKQRWPELALAHTDCLGCHHDLKRNSPRLRGFEGRPGRPQVQRWPLALVRQGLGADQAEAGNFQQAFGLLVQALNDRPFGDPEAVAKCTRDLALWADKQVAARPLAGLQFSREELLQQLQNLCTPPGRGYVDYESARQIVSAVRAIYGELNPKPAQDAEIRKLLASFEADFDLRPEGGRRQRLILLKDRLEKLSGAKLLNAPKALEGVELIANRGLLETFPKKPDSPETLAAGTAVRNYLDTLRGQGGQDFTDALLKDREFLEALTKINDQETEDSLRKTGNYDLDAFQQRLAAMQKLLAE